MVSFPDRKYEIIYADPPWQYQSNGMKGSSGERWVCNWDKHYGSMSTFEIGKLPVSDIADMDCLLFLWVVSPMLTDGIQVGSAWGFEYKTVVFVWHKDSQPVAGSYTQSQCELCLIFKKGKIPQPRGARNVQQFLSCKRGKHSEKPWEIRTCIEEMFPDQSKIELFSRTPFKGWDVWGDQIDSGQISIEM